MPEMLSHDKDVLDVIVQALTVVIPGALAWFARAYVRSASASTKVDSTARLSNAAIDFVENLDVRGELTTPAGSSTGAYKRSLATEWLERETRRLGIRIPPERAAEWISSEFQRRGSSGAAASPLTEVVGLVMDRVKTLEGNPAFTIPAAADRQTYLNTLAADLLQVELTRRGSPIGREEAETWVRAAFAEALLEPRVGSVNSAADLDTLADQAVAYATRLASTGRLGIKPAEGEDVTADLVTARLLTLVAEAGIEATTWEIAGAVRSAIGKRG